MNVISLKDYAKQNNISYEAVRQQVVRYAGDLGEHIIRDGRQQFLDEEAVKFLDGKRQKNPVVVIQQDKDEQIKELEKQIKQLLIDNAEQSKKLTKLSEWKADNAVAIASAGYNKILLEEKTKTINDLETKNRDLSADRDVWKDKAAQADKTAQEASDELTAIKGKWWYKLFAGKNKE